jgi:hypothetical protein
VVSGEADVGVLLRPRATLVRVRSVADEVPEAPDLVDSVVVDRLGGRLERGQVSVDV